MKKNRKKITALVTGIVMTASVILGGCSKDAGKTPDGKQTNGMGRYVETAIPLPFEQKEGEYSFAQVAEGENGNIILYHIPYVDRSPVSKLDTYEWDGSQWNEIENNWNLELLGKEIGISQFQRNADGTEYLSYMDYGNWSSNQTEEEGGDVSLVPGEADADMEEGDFAVNIGELDENGEMKTPITYAKILKKDVDGTIEFLAEEDLEELGDASWVKVLENEDLLISGYSEISHVSKTGEVYHTFLRESSFYGSTTDLITANESELITLDSQEQSLIRYDINKKEVTEKIPTANLDRGVLTSKGEILYLANREGIHIWQKGGSIWETIADGSLNTLGTPSLSLRDILLVGEEEYYIFGQDTSNTLHFYKYSYDPDMASVPYQTLNVFGLTDSQNVRQAISDFQKSYPDVKVNYQVGNGGSEGAVTTDIIKALNTELISKKGADVLLLDGLPVEDYIEKGILTDLSDWIKPMLEDQTLLPNIAGVYTQKDGSVYRVPTRFSMPIVSGDDKSLQALNSLKGLNEYEKAPGDLPLFYDKTDMQQLKLFMNLFSNEITNEDGTISRENLTVLLEASKKYYEEGITEKEIESGSPEEEEFLINGGGSDFGMDFMNLYLEETAIGIATLKSMSDFLLPAEIMKQRNLTPQTINDMFYAEQMAGINNASANKELAKEFIQILLSDGMQKMNFDEGFPVNKNALENWRVTDPEMMVAMQGEDYSLFAEWPSLTQVDQLLDLIPNLKTPVTTDRVWMEMIENEAKGYFEGKTDAVKTAEAIENRMALYFAE